MPEMNEQLEEIRQQIEELRTKIDRLMGESMRQQQLAEMSALSHLILAPADVAQKYNSDNSIAYVKRRF